MNKTENRFAQLLHARMVAGEIVAYEFEPMRLRLGADWKCSYTPDFLIEHPDGVLELADVKGGRGWEDDARVKIQTAARMYPQFWWTGWKERRHGQRGVFDQETFGGARD